jgi:hypothetical protein
MIIFNVALNSLMGTIPNGIVNFDLTTLQMQFNSLTGTIPSNLRFISALTKLDLAYNSLAGPIPGSIEDLSRLVYFSLDHNSLTGRIPTGLGLISGLTLIYLHSNSFSGTIPESISNLANLVIEVQTNSLSGCQPTLTNAVFYTYYPQFSPERVALEAFYDSTAGGAWSSNTNWKANDDLGTWFGVTAACESAEVTVIRVNTNNLAGTNASFAAFFPIFSC